MVYQTIGGGGTVNRFKMNTVIFVYVYDIQRIKQSLSYLHCSKHLSAFGL